MSNSSKQVIQPSAYPVQLASHGNPVADANAADNNLQYKDKWSTNQLTSLTATEHATSVMPPFWEKIILKEDV